MPHSIFSPRRYLQHPDHVEQLAGGRAGRQWIVARALCHYRLFDLSELPAGQRIAALHVRLAQWTPFAEFASHVAWQRGLAQVWVWDRARQQQAMAEAGVKNAQVLPESVLRPKPEQDGVQVVKLLAGVEARVWHEEVLRASHWWPAEPEPRVWQRFLRANHLPLDSFSSPGETALLAKPWGRGGQGILESVDFRQDRLWFFWIGAVVVIALSWQAMYLWKQQQRLESLNTENETLTRQVAPILQARNQAMTDQETSLALLGLHPYPSQVELMAAVARALPREQAYLTEWNYRNGELEVTIETNNPDPLFYVKRFQESPWFDEIQPESGRGPRELVLKIQVNPRYPESLE